MVFLTVDFHLEKFKGDREAAMRNLAGLVKMAKNLYSHDKQYAVQFCRFHEIFHPDPFEEVLQAFIVKAIKEFSKSVEDFYNPAEQKDKSKKRSGPIYEKPRRKRDDMEDIEKGGFAPLIEAFMLLLKLFDKDKPSGQDIMSKLLPPQGDPTRPEFLMYNMAAKMSRTGKAPTEIFKLMDEDGGGTLSYPEFVEGMQNKLDVMFS